MSHVQPLTNALIIFLGSLMAAALLIAAFNSPFESIMSTATTVGASGEAQAGRNIINDAWALLPFGVVLLGLIQLIGAAARESRV